MTEKAINILIVDDDIHVLKTLAAIIDDFGMVPIQAENVAEALDHLKSMDIDLIFTDIVMPEIDGLEFIDIVKDSYPSIPIAVISAYGIIPNTVAALGKGAYNFVTKPFSLLEIKAIVERGLRLRHLSLNTDILSEKVSNTTIMEIPGEPGLFTAVIYYIVKECQWRGIENDIVLTNVSHCLDELLLNALVHGHKENETKLMSVKAHFTHNALTLTVKDKGKGFDHQKYMEEISITKPLSTKKKGLFIIRTIVDELSFNSKGNEVTVRFRL